MSINPEASSGEKKERSILEQDSRIIRMPDDEAHLQNIDAQILEHAEKAKHYEELLQDPSQKDQAEHLENQKKYEDNVGSVFETFRRNGALDLKTILDVSKPADRDLTPNEVEYIKNIFLTIENDVADATPKGAEVPAPAGKPESTMERIKRERAELAVAEAAKAAAGGAPAPDSGSAPDTSKPSTGSAKRKETAKPSAEASAPKDSGKPAERSEPVGATPEEEGSTFFEDESGNREIDPLARFKGEAVRTITAEWAETTDIGDGPKEFVKGLLAGDAKKISQEFALQWFKDNLEEIMNKGVIVPRDASAEWKINQALAMGAMDKIMERDYKENFGYRIEQLGIIEAGMQESKMSPETPFLALHYLQEKYEAGQTELISMRAKIGTGSAGLEAEITAKEHNMEVMFSAMKEISGKTMHEDLQRNANEAATDGMISKEEDIEDRLRDEMGRVRDQKNEALVNVELQKFMALAPKERAAYQKKYGMKLEMTRGEFDKETQDNGYTSGQADREFQLQKFLRFDDGMKKLSIKNGIHYEDMCALLEDGYKPHEAKIKGFFWQNVVIPKQGGEPETMPIQKGTNFIDASASIEKYSTKIENQSRQNLDRAWENDHSNRARVKMEIRIKDLAKSPENAINGIKGVYEKARERMAAKLSEKQLEPQTKSHLEAIRKTFGARGKEADIAGIMSDALFKKGKLAGFGDNLEEDSKSMRGFLGDWGMRVSPKVLSGFSGEYAKAGKTQMGLLDLVIRIIGEAYKSVIAKSRPVKRR